MSKQVKDGVVESYYENGQIKTRASYKDGKLDGLWERWHPNGQLAVRACYVNGEWHGVQGGWYENGQMMYRDYFHGGLAHGMRVDWYDNGELKACANHINDKLDGFFVSWTSLGDIKSHALYKDGKEVDLPDEFWFDVAPTLEGASALDVIKHINENIDTLVVTSDNFHQNVPKQSSIIDEAEATLGADWKRGASDELVEHQQRKGMGV